MLLTFQANWCCRCRDRNVAHSALGFGGSYGLLYRGSLQVVVRSRWKMVLPDVISEDGFTDVNHAIFASVQQPIPRRLLPVHAQKESWKLVRLSVA